MFPLLSGQNNHPILICNTIFCCYPLQLLPFLLLPPLLLSFCILYFILTFFLCLQFGISLPWNVLLYFLHLFDISLLILLSFFITFLLSFLYNLYFYSFTSSTFTSLLFLLLLLYLHYFYSFTSSTITLLHPSFYTYILFMSLI
jgi:hypothetical protein